LPSSDRSSKPDLETRTDRSRISQHASLDRAASGFVNETHLASERLRTNDRAIMLVVQIIATDIEFPSFTGRANCKTGAEKNIAWLDTLRIIARDVEYLELYDTIRSHLS
jgi:hypothetical protein